MKHQVLEPQLIYLPQTLLVGQRRIMSMADDQTPALWRGFMPRRKEITRRSGTHYYNVKVHTVPLQDFTPQSLFEKWAAVKVTDFSDVPQGMEPFILPPGEYAVFHHQGGAAAFSSTVSYIFGTWLPRSEYLLDARPHFEILQEHYRPDDPEAEEEVWIPVRKP
ncbi:MAG: GyrI-like domain-containing protein [Bacteroidia bacterium]|nr:GyrI-like domain-containing protein [Bacteroidia bacterium]